MSEDSICILNPIQAMWMSVEGKMRVLEEAVRLPWTSSVHHGSRQHGRAQAPRGAGTTVDTGKGRMR